MKAEVIEAHREVYNQMISEHSHEIRFLHSIGEGNRFGMIYITNDDEAFGVGYNGDFNLLGPSGENFLKKRLDKPVRIDGLSGKGIKKLSVGDHFAIGLGKDGKLYRWGLPYSEIRLSYDKSSIRLPYLATLCNHSLSKFDCGGGYFAIITNHQQVFMWGYIDWSSPFSDGRLFSPMHKKVIAIACGAWHFAMLSSDGKPYTLGHGGYGQLGYDWSADDGYWKVGKIYFDEPCTTICAGSASTMFVTASGELWACGLNHPQFGYLGVDSEEPSIKKPARVKIDDPVSDVSVSYTLSNLHNIYGAKSKDGTKIYAWGWGFESKWPQIFEGTTSLYDVFHYLATPQGLGDRYVPLALEDDLKSDFATQPNVAPSIDDDIISNTIEKTENDFDNDSLELPNCHAKRHCEKRHSKISNKLNNFQAPNKLHKNFRKKLLLKDHNLSGNSLRSDDRACNLSAYKAYLDYAYSGGSKHIEFTDLIEIHVLAVGYEEQWLIEHTLDHIKRVLNEVNFPILLEQSQIHNSDHLTKLGQSYIMNLCEEPQKVVDLVMSLKLSNR